MYLYKNHLVRHENLTDDSSLQFSSKTSFRLFSGKLDYANGPSKVKCG